MRRDKFGLLAEAQGRLLKFTHFWPRACALLPGARGSRVGRVPVPKSRRLSTRGALGAGGPRGSFYRHTASDPETAVPPHEGSGGPRALIMLTIYLV